MRPQVPLNPADVHSVAHAFDDGGAGDTVTPMAFQEIPSVSLDHWRDAGADRDAFADRLRQIRGAPVETWPAEPDVLDYVALVDDEHEHRRTRRKRGLG